MASEPSFKGIKVCILNHPPAHCSYFKAHISWLKKYICDDPAIIIDSTGLPHAIKMNIQKKMHTSFEGSEEIFMGLRNQKCIVYASRIITNEGQSGATQYYNKFKIKYPVSFDTSGTGLKPTYGVSN